MNRRLAIAAAAIVALLATTHGGLADETLRCAPFTTEALAEPVARDDGNSRARLAAINRDVATQNDRILFLGDSITQRWDATVWRRDMAPRGVINAGINGDRTEHLLWRLDHGNLAGPPPPGVAVLIGTNDLGHGRSPALAAAGIRAVLLKLRARLPHARILLLGLWPRSAEPSDRLRREVGAVNRRIKTCADDATIVYADLGDVLLESDGRLSTAISSDRLHFSQRGYLRLAPGLDAALDRLVAGRR